MNFRDIIRKTPGFRSGSKVKSAIASVVYLFVILIILAFIIPTAPTLALNEISPTSQDKATITGKTGYKKPVVVLKDGNAIAEITAGDDGKFSVEVKDLIEGENKFTVKACREKEQKHCTLKEITILVDKNLPPSPLPSLQVTPTPAVKQAAREKVRIIRVIDGDTIEIEGGRKVRYIGIDTPETVHPDKPVQCFGYEATNKNKELVDGKEIEMEKDVSETDKYGRLLRYVWIGNIFVNDYLVRQGYAYAITYPPDVKYQDQFRQAQQEAIANNRGLWSQCAIQEETATQVTPTPYTAPQESGGCVIKGNISYTTGEKIYHVPGCPNYNQTVINESKGERWFCTEEEAIAAGWRKALNCP